MEIIVFVGFPHPSELVARVWTVLPSTLEEREPEVARSGQESIRNDATQIPDPTQCDPMCVRVPPVAASNQLVLGQKWQFPGSATSIRRAASAGMS